MVIVATPLHTQNPQPQIWPQHQKSAGLKSKIVAIKVKSKLVGNAHTIPRLHPPPPPHERDRHRPVPFASVRRERHMAFKLM